MHWVRELDACITVAFACGELCYDSICRDRSVLVDSVMRIYLKWRFGGMIETFSAPYGNHDCIQDILAVLTHCTSIVNEIHV
jgi:hypothetical protein